MLDLLDRCDALRGLVRGTRRLPDRRVAALLAGARALLFPSFAEGYGLPVAEALALGVPVLCSDLPALREVGGEVPEYLDPLDGAGWRARVLDYAAGPGPPRAPRSSAAARTGPRPLGASISPPVDGLLEQVVSGGHGRAARPPAPAPPACPA